MNLSDAALDDIGLTRAALSERRGCFEPVRLEEMTVAPLFAALALPSAMQAA